jgi:hypothetical protein
MARTRVRRLADQRVIGQVVFALAALPPLAHEPRGLARQVLRPRGLDTVGDHDPHGREARRARRLARFEQAVALRSAGLAADAVGPGVFPPLRRGHDETAVPGAAQFTQFTRSTGLRPQRGTPNSRISPCRCPSALSRSQECHPRLKHRKTDRPQHVAAAPIASPLVKSDRRLLFLHIAFALTRSTPTSSASRGRSWGTTSAPSATTGSA